MRSRDAVLVCLNQRIERLSVTAIVQETYFVACMGCLACDPDHEKAKPLEHSI
ncbi:hypothetical protein MGG_17126 [Pyricularia oryzae 70-15]|uniref:Uncharacterized protein n=1 Tax=Pyricularia oryzae (strain 70-15 / ATCC MYA-4617 / FGSC 8958) TaxID=242507 RepID=G4N9K1_PYRO7|nr:uncharacterized protein MGG_17126 [Pyricularia oryzae 70-15]EHA50393.1 hypothetical protein MGG_17126 [Pyricularia oryzae 70-15]